MRVFASAPALQRISPCRPGGGCSEHAQCSFLVDSWQCSLQVPSVMSQSWNERSNGKVVNTSNFWGWRSKCWKTIIHEMLPNETIKHIFMISTNAILSISTAVASLCHDLEDNTASTKTLFCPIVLFPSSDTAPHQQQRTQLSDIWIKHKEKTPSGGWWILRRSLWECINSLWLGLVFKLCSYNCDVFSDL